MKKTLPLALVIMFLSITSFWYIQYSQQRQPQTIDRPITIGIDVFPGWGHAFIAQEKSFFTNNGVEVELVLNEDYLKIQDMFATSELDGAFMVYADAIYSHDSGAHPKVVYISDYSIQGDVLTGRPDLKTLKDLRGKNVGVEGINSFSHLFVLSALETVGMKEGDIFIKNIQAQDVVTAIQNGEIVAGHTYGPGRLEAQKNNFVPLAFSGDVPGIISDVLVFNADFTHNHPKEVTAIIKSLFEAKAFQKNYPDETAQIIADATHTDVESVKLGINAVKHLDITENQQALIPSPSESFNYFYDGHKKISNFYLSRGQIFDEPQFANIIDNSFINSLQP